MKSRGYQGGYGVICLLGVRSQRVLSRPGQVTDYRNASSRGQITGLMRQGVVSWLMLCQGGIARGPGLMNQRRGWAVTGVMCQGGARSAGVMCQGGARQLT